MGADVAPVVGDALDDGPSQNRIARFGIYVDFRNPLQWRTADSHLYAENIELVRRCEELGFGAVWVSEHHFSDDGYAPSPLILAAALAQATSVMRIGTAVAILPLYNAIRFAEDAAVVDILSEGRLEVGVGIGWRPQEFQAFGVPIRERGSRTNSALTSICAHWAGEPVLAEQDADVNARLVVSPRPVQSPRPRIWVGGSSKASLRRAARYADGIIVSDFTEAMRDDYHDQLIDAGRPVTEARVASNLRWFMVSHDPPATFRYAAPFVCNWYNHYAAWMAGNGPFSFVHSEEELRARNLLTVVTPDEAVNEIRRHSAIAPLDFLNIKARPPGMPMDVAIQQLELFASEVMPSFT
jgi:alkanesulfonate monooxygenase SsuD/methylene tetrahydromethanopterin reductase-like flavin-dependent oxidoreductase (luciferase family)